MHASASWVSDKGQIDRWCCQWHCILPTPKYCLFRCSMHPDWRDCVLLYLKKGTVIRINTSPYENPQEKPIWKQRFAVLRIHRFFSVLLIDCSQHALFSSSRRWNGLGFSDSFDHDQDADQPRRRSSAFKLNNSPFALSKRKSSSELTSSDLAFPKDGAGDRVSSKLDNSALDVNAVEEDVCIEVVRDFVSFPCELFCDQWIMLFLVLQ